MRIPKFEKLYGLIDHEKTYETEHADQLIRRILFLGGTPNLSQRDPLNIGAVPQILEHDLKLEIRVITALKEAIAYCESEQVRPEKYSKSC